MQINIITKLISQSEHFGQRANLRKQSGTSALARLKKELGRKGPSQKNSASTKKERQRKPIDHQAVPYLQNDKSTRSEIISKIVVSSIDEFDFEAADKTIATFESMPGLDVSTLKSRYSEHKAAAEKKYFGELNDKIVPDGVAKAYQEEMFKHSIDWVRNQISIIMYSDEQFEGSQFDEVHGCYVLAVKSKTVITGEFLSSLELQSLKAAPSKEMPLMRVSSNQPKILEIREDGSRYTRALKENEDLDDFVGMIVR